MIGINGPGVGETWDVLLIEDKSSQKIYIVVLNCSYYVSVVGSETAGKNGAFARSKVLNFVFFSQKLRFWVPLTGFEHCRLFR